ncbi:MAG: TetR/AcrR family transcriptional regulator [Pseudomonadota bacterium]|nr:TetR/AcrR family transcriptional regulator [Pseudomonadota bacterium]MEE2820919.1 TetR/AcrR family transcriptional regulator [Pseudomonadota bacterium]
MNLSEAVRLERDKRKRQAFFRREQDILSVCESLMAERGVRQVSVDMVAARTGIGKGTIYKHFDSKRDMLIAIAARYFKMLIDLLGRSKDPMCAVSEWIEAQLYAARRSLLIHELVDILEDDSDALNKIQDARYQMRKRLAQVLSGSSSTQGRPFERAMWLDAIVRGALVEMESALKSESFDEDEWVESITRIVPVLMSQSKIKIKRQDLTYL